MRAGINATLEEIERAAADGRPARWPVRCRPPSRTSRTRRATCASPSSTTAASARSSGAWRPPAPRSPSTRTTSTRTSWPAYDGVLLSNGPGDPEPLRDEIATVSDLLGRVPVLGICLGHQLLALATGHETYKLPFGHRGANHPVLERRTGRVLVTSQNHGFAVREAGRAHGDPRLALRRHRRGARLPRAPCSLAAVPPRGRAGAARRPPADRVLGRGGPCRGVATSTRSASSAQGRSSSARRASSTTPAARRSRCCARTASARSSSTRTRPRS